MKRTMIFAAMLIVLILAWAALAQAQAADSGSYDLSWYTIDGGGATFSTGGSYSLGGSIGQPDAGSMNGGSYQLNGGFWGSGASQYQVYLPVVIK